MEKEMFKKFSDNSLITKNLIIREKELSYLIETFSHLKYGDISKLVLEDWTEELKLY